MKITKPYTNLIVKGIKHILREGEEEDPACTTQFAVYCLEPCSARVRFREKSSDGLPPGGASWGYFSSGEGTLCASQVEMSCHFLLCALTGVSRPRFVCVLLPVPASEQLLVICRVD